MNGRLTVQEAAARLRQMNNVLLLTHVRPDGDTIGSAAALCQALRDMGKTAYLLYNPEITDTYAPYAAPLLGIGGLRAGAHRVRRHRGAEPAAGQRRPYASRVELTIDHHGSQEFFRSGDVPGRGCRRLRR